MNAPRKKSGSAASVRARLRALARRRNVEFQLLLSEFAIERLLYRLGISKHAERFVLKGAALFKLWSGEKRRATWDLDLLGYGTGGVEELAAVVRHLCEIRTEDGIDFDPASVTGEEIRFPDEYQGVRVRLQARLAEARIPVQVDVGFGDAVVPAPRLVDYPALLEHPAPRILVYPREAVVAEKIEAMVSLGITNSRMKDFYDVHRLASCTAFEGETLVEAIRATFQRRGTALPDEEPRVLTPGFLAASERQVQWRAFLRRCRLEAPVDAGELAEDLRRFLLPVLAATSGKKPYTARWRPGGPWVHEGKDEAQ